MLEREYKKDQYEIAAKIKMKNTKLIKEEKLEEKQIHNKGKQAEKRKQLSGKDLEAFKRKNRERKIIERKNYLDEVRKKNSEASNKRKQKF